MYSVLSCIFNLYKRYVIIFVIFTKLVFLRFITLLYIHLIQVSDHCIVLHGAHLPIYLCTFPVMDTQVAVNSQQGKTPAVHILVHIAVWTLWDYLCCTDPEVEILDHKLYVYLIFYISTKLISSLYSYLQCMKIPILPPFCQ